MIICRQSRLTRNWQKQQQQLSSGWKLAARRGILCRWRLCSLSAKSGNLILLAAAADLVCKHRFVSNRGRRAEAGRHICRCCKIYLFSNEEDPRYRAPSSPLRAYDEDFQLRKALKAADKHRCRRRAAVAASLDARRLRPSFLLSARGERGRRLLLHRNLR